MTDVPKAGVGVVLVGHQGAAASLLAAIDKIAKVPMQSSPLAGALALDADEGCDKAFAQKLEAAFVAVDKGQGILVLVDLYGSSSASFCTCLLSRYGAHLVSGLNLPMLLTLALLPDQGQSAAALAQSCAQAGRRAIIHREPQP